MHHLRSLSLAGNPITAIMNDSFVGLERLEELDISQIRADGFSVRIFPLVMGMYYSWDPKRDQH